MRAHCALSRATPVRSVAAAPLPSLPALKGGHCYSVHATIMEFSACASLPARLKLLTRIFRVAQAAVSCHSSPRRKARHFSPSPSLPLFLLANHTSRRSTLFAPEQPPSLRTVIQWCEIIAFQKITVKRHEGVENCNASSLRRFVGRLLSPECVPFGGCRRSILSEENAFGPRFSHPSVFMYFYVLMYSCDSSVIIIQISWYDLFLSPVSYRFIFEFALHAN